MKLDLKKGEAEIMLEALELMRDAIDERSGKYDDMEEYELDNLWPEVEALIEKVKEHI